MRTNLFKTVMLTPFMPGTFLASDGNRGSSVRSSVEDNSINSLRTNTQTNFKGAKQRLRTQLAAYKVLQGTNQYLEMTDSFKSFLNRKRLADFRSS